MSNIAIKAEQISKAYRLYDKPFHRIAETFHPFRKKYHKVFYALNKMSLEVCKGETFGIIGKNGSGKSTLLKILTGTLTPTEGSVFLNGRVASLLELGAGFNPELTGIENIYFSGTIMGFSRKEMDVRRDAIISFADIGDFINQPAKTYSSGMFARLAFAVNMILDPDILIVDEALAVGDASFVQRCMLRFKKIQEQGKTIILVTHDITMIKQLCTRALWLDKGVVRMEGDVESIANGYLRYVHDITQEAPIQVSEHNIFIPQCAHSITENGIPNNDGRSGDQSISILGVKLYDENMNPITIVSNDSWVVLRLSMINNTVALCPAIGLGYLIRNRLGMDWASSNSYSNNVDLGLLECGATTTVDIRIHIPLLYPEDYSLSPSAGYIDSDGKVHVTDWIENAILFKVTSKLHIHIQMQFYSQYQRIV